MSELAAAPIGQVVAPGDKLIQLPEKGQVRVGSGLHQEGNFLIGTRAGILNCSKDGKLWVEGRQKRYIPSKEDKVIGIVTERHAENFVVDIKGPVAALLPVLSFEGATRRNRPNLQPGDLVYARVEQAHRDLEPTLSCVDATGKATEFGPLKDGYLIEVTSSHARALLSKNAMPLLSALGAKLEYELVVGLNGRVWVSSPQTSTTILVANAILRSEFLTAAQAQVMAAELLRLHGS